MPDQNILRDPVEIKLEERDYVLRCFARKTGNGKPFYVIFVAAPREQSFDKSSSAEKSNFVE